MSVAGAPLFLHPSSKRWLTPVDTHTHTCKPHAHTNTLVSCNFGQQNIGLGFHCKSWPIKPIMNRFVPLEYQRIHTAQPYIFIFIYSSSSDVFISSRLPFYQIVDPIGDWTKVLNIQITALLLQGSLWRSKWSWIHGMGLVRCWHFTSVSVNRDSTVCV
jgi:hypothetical protein